MIDQTIEGTAIGCQRKPAVEARYCPGSTSAGGFTLMELMIVVLLVSLMATIGVPAYRVQALNSQMTGTANDLLATLQSARGESSEFHQRVPGQRSGHRLQRHHLERRLDSL